MRPLPPGIDPASLPDIAHYRRHGIDRITAWCLAPFCRHQGTVTFAELATHGASERTKLLALKPGLTCTKVRRPTRGLAAGLVPAERRSGCQILDVKVPRGRDRHACRPRAVADDRPAIRELNTGAQGSLGRPNRCAGTDRFQARSVRSPWTVKLISVKAAKGILTRWRERLRLDWLAEA
jgi:hypothetical protein